MVKFSTGSFESERKKIYNGNDLMELNSHYSENQDVATRLKNLIPKAHQRLMSEHKSHSAEPQILTNRVGNISFKAEVETLTSLEQLVMIMKNAAKENKRIKTVGTFASFSPITETDGCILETDKYSGISKTDVNLLQQDVKIKANEEGITYYNVLCGTKLNTLIKHLKEEGKALFNLGGWDGQSLAGLNATSTHGSGVALQPLCHCVMSVDMVVSGGQLYHIEPTKGITDPAKFRSQNPNVILIQDDKTFNASVVNIGSLGVTHSLTVATQPIYSIIEVREETTWKEAKSILRHRPYDKNPYLNNRNFEIWISPYTDYALVSKRNLATKEDEQKYPKPEAKELLQDFLQLPVVDEVAKMLNVGLGGALFLLLHLFPATVPFLIETALRTQYHKEPVVDIFNNIYVLNSGANDFKVIAVELSFSTKDDIYIEATDAVLAKLKELREKHNLNINGPVSMRFSAASSQYLSMAYNEDMDVPRAYIEMAILLYHPHVDYYKHVYNPLVATALQYGGRCHWGQYFSDDLDHKYLTNAYSAEAIATFIEQLKKFDPNGLMGNNFLKKLGLTLDEKLVSKADGWNITKIKESVQSYFEGLSS